MRFLGLWLADDRKVAVFDSIGWGEVVVLALAALFIFGPDRLPSLTRDATRALARLRVAMRDVRGQFDETLGDELAVLRDIDIRRYHPKTLIRDQLLGHDDAGGR
jgi:sec-independent protein translocase protein TatB